MPNVLHPDVRTRRKKQPMHRYKEKTNKIRGERNTHEKHGERKPLVLEGIVHGTNQQVEWPQELETKFQNEIGQDDQHP